MTRNWICAFSALAFSLSVFIRLAPAQATNQPTSQVEPDKERVDLANKRAAERAKQRNDEFDKSAPSIISSLKIQIENLKQRITELEKENGGLKRLLAQLRPATPAAGGKSPTTVASIIQVSPVQLETLGERFLGKTVQMNNVTFVRADNLYLDDLPGTKLNPDDDESRVQKDRENDWIGFWVRDAQGNAFGRVFANKAKFGDVLVSTPEDTKVSLSGSVVELQRSKKFALICTEFSAQKK